MYPVGMNMGMQTLRGMPAVISALLFATLARSASSQTASTTIAPPMPYGPTPSEQQLAWHNRQFYAFVHFNMNTFTGVEWGEGNESPDRFDPEELDCRQWCALFKECGLSGVIITA